MSRAVRRIAATAGAAALAGGVAFATAAPAQAYDYSHTTAKAEVVQQKQAVDTWMFGCNFLPVGPEPPAAPAGDPWSRGSNGPTLEIAARRCTGTSRAGRCPTTRRRTTSASPAESEAVSCRMVP